jgi:pimeloyl-ACP methyl ester carboxylesterase
MRILSLVGRPALLCLALAALGALACRPGPRGPAAVELEEGRVEGPSAGVQALADGLPLAYTQYGEGEPTLVLIHGIAADQNIWRDQIDTFASRYGVIAIDLPGHGASGRNRASWTIEQMGQDVALLLSSLKLRQVRLVGHRLGGLVALSAARHAPDAVQAVVGIAAFYDPRRPGLSSGQNHPSPPLTAAERAAWENDFPASCRSFVRSTFGAMTEEALVNRIADAQCAVADPAVALALREDVSRFDVGAALRVLRIPVRAINPLEGAAVDLEGLRRARPDFIATTVDRTGEYILLEQPDELNRQLGQILLELG